MSRVSGVILTILALTAAIVLAVQLMGVLTQWALSP